MTLQQLKYFVSVANHLSFSRAAEENYVSQTAISQQIKLLEEDLGISLFDRTHRWVRLTRAAVSIMNTLSRFWTWPRWLPAGPGPSAALKSKN